MCGRYSLTLPPDAVRDFFGYAEVPNFPPRYNIAPTQPIAVVRLIDGQRSFSLMRWGLIPGWCKDPKTLPTLINARAESAAGKPAFRAAMRRRRCVIPADGFYEWQKTQTGQKMPHLIRRPDAAPFAFAGLWENWSGPDGAEMDTAAILTTTANDALSPLHERMPVVVAREDFDRWCDAERHGPAEVADILRPVPDDFFEAFPISARVNAVANDDASLQAPLADSETSPAVAEGSKERPERNDRDTGQMSLF